MPLTHVENPDIGQQRLIHFFLPKEIQQLLSDPLWQKRHRKPNSPHHLWLHLGSLVTCGTTNTDGTDTDSVPGRWGWRAWGRGKRPPCPAASWRDAALCCSLALWTGGGSDAPPHSCTSKLTHTHTQRISTSWIQLNVCTKGIYTRETWMCGNVFMLLVFQRPTAAALCFRYQLLYTTCRQQWATTWRCPLTTKTHKFPLLCFSTENKQCMFTADIFIYFFWIIKTWNEHMYM